MTKEEKLSIQNLSTSLIDAYPNHPFKIVDDEEMIELSESIADNGLLLPVLVRAKEDGRYEMISGHRRLRASELAGKSIIQAVVCDYDDDMAAIVMVESNIHQRENILPSEKAFAYKMLYNAMKHQGKRTDLTSDPLGQKFAREELAEKIGESQTQIQRYISLTKLVPELLEYMDEGKIALRPGVELSYLDEDCQRDIVDFIDVNESFPSHAQAIRMRRLFENCKLDTQSINKILSEKKPNQRDKLIFRGDKVRSLIPKSVPIEKTEEYVCKALEHYAKYLQKQRNRGAR